ncbi:MAG: PASTA domain-containing protein [Gemmatimonadetes bacterium]|nr:PASTA domain-containing protein [Gemmatimonadota bacterium]
MKLGGSLRRTRRRHAGASQEEPRSRWSRAGGRRGGRGRVGWGRVVLWALGLGVVGWGGAYVVATRILFPAPPPPPGLIQVPDLRGLEVDTAAQRLADAGLHLGAVDSLRHPTVAPGLILGQAPLPGQLALPGTSVRVTRSLGPQRAAVPDVAGVTLDRARVVLETSGFVVKVDSTTADVPRGRVIAMDPPADSMVALPGQVRLTVSLGPPLVPMPSVLGMDEAAARAVLDSLGLVVGKVQEVFRFGRDQGIVVEQEPPADSLLERGSAVRLSIGRRGG